MFLKVKSMSRKTAPLYPDQLHLKFECLCFFSCFYILFCFSSLPDQYLPIWRSKTFSLFCSPCCWFWLKGIGVGVGERESESIFNHKDNSFSLTRPAVPERIWHLRGPSSKSNSYLLGSWNRRDWSSKWTAGMRMGQGFGGGDPVQVKMEKLSINTGGRTDSKTPEASSNAALNHLQEDSRALEWGRWPRCGESWLCQLLKCLERSNSASQTSVYTRCCWSVGHPLSRKALIRSFRRAQAKDNKGRWLDIYFLFSPVCQWPCPFWRPHSFCTYLPTGLHHRCSKCVEIRDWVLLIFAYKALPRIGTS